MREEGSLRTRRRWTMLAVMVTSTGGAVVLVVCRLRESRRKGVREKDRKEKKKGKRKDGKSVRSL